MHFTDNDELLKIIKSSNLKQTYLTSLAKNEILINSITENRSQSKIGGDPLLPGDFEPPKNYYFLAQFDLANLSQFYPSEVTKSAFPKSGILSVFIRSTENDFYEDEFLDNPGVKLFYFSEIEKLYPKSNIAKKVTETKRVSHKTSSTTEVVPPILKADADGTYKTYFESLNQLIAGGAEKATIKIVKNDYILEFSEQFLSFSFGISLPNDDLDPEFEVSAESEDDYYKLCAEATLQYDSSRLSNFFGWSSNRQPISKQEYLNIQNFYKNDSKIVHLFSFTNDLGIGIDNEIEFQSISVFLFEEDLQNGRFDRAWMIPCFD